MPRMAAPPCASVVWLKPVRTNRRRKEARFDTVPRLHQSGRVRLTSLPHAPGARTMRRARTLVVLVGLASSLAACRGGGSPAVAVTADFHNPTGPGFAAQAPDSF